MTKITVKAKNLTQLDCKLSLIMNRPTRMTLVDIQLGNDGEMLMAVITFKR